MSAHEIILHLKRLLSRDLAWWSSSIDTARNDSAAWRGYLRKRTHMAFEQEIKVYQFLLGYGEMLLADIPEAEAFKLICEGGVSPAWIIGHLGFVGNRALAMGGGEPKIDFDAWQPMFGGGSTPQGEADTKLYPSWDQLLKVWRAGHADVAARLPLAEGDALKADNPNERMRGGLPTVGDLISFILTGHEAMHLGQLSTWRRVQGRPPLF